MPCDPDESSGCQAAWCRALSFWDVAALVVVPRHTMLEGLRGLVEMEILLLQPAVPLAALGVLLVQRLALGKREDDVPLVHRLEGVVGLEGLLIHAPIQRDTDARIGAPAHQQSGPAADGRTFEEGAPRRFVQRRLVVDAGGFAGLALGFFGFWRFGAHDTTSTCDVCVSDGARIALSRAIRGRREARPVQLAMRHSQSLPSKLTVRTCSMPRCNTGSGSKGSGDASKAVENSSASRARRATTLAETRPRFGRTAPGSKR